MSSSVMCQYSDPYSRFERTQLLYNFNCVCVLYCCDLHTGLSILKAFLALPILLMISVQFSLDQSLCFLLDRPIHSRAVLYTVSPSVLYAASTSWSYSTMVARRYSRVSAKDWVVADSLSLPILIKWLKAHSCV